MDGTLVDSRAVVERVWKMWALRNNLEPTVILEVAHSRRAIDTVREFSTGKMNLEREVRWLAHEEIVDVEGIVAVPGAAQLLKQLQPNDWAVVTSAERKLANLRLKVAGLPVPQTFITAENVRNGKPSAEGFELAANRLGTKAGNCIVFEDSPAGIEAGMNAGSDVVAISAARSHDFEAMCPTVVDFTQVSFRLRGRKRYRV